MKDLLNRILGEGFRIFFLASAVYAFLSVLVWEIWLATQTAGGTPPGMPFSVAPYLWHAHEMVFGYAGAALGGFFLTAVPNWTGARAARHLFIGAVAGIWLAGRLAVWYSALLPGGLVATVDLAFLPVLGAKVASQLYRRPKSQNLLFLLFLTQIWIGDLMVHMEWMGLASGDAYTGLRVGLFGLLAMIAVLGGRLTPAFTRNAMNRAGMAVSSWPVSRPAIEALVVVPMVALPFALILGLPDTWLAGMTLLAGGAQAVRLMRWRTRWVLNQPILWSLHMGMAMLALGLVLWGLALLGAGSEVAALHVLAIGCVGGMTLAVMSRATLGHTGRALVAPRPVVLGYGLVGLAALTRWAGVVLPSTWYLPAMLVSGAFWLTAFSLFLVTLGPVLLGPRADRRPVAAAS